jgi:hypothetical protein
MRAAYDFTLHKRPLLAFNRGRQIGAGVLIGERKQIRVFDMKEKERKGLHRRSPYR